MTTTPTSGIFFKTVFRRLFFKNLPVPPVIKKDCNFISDYINFIHVKMTWFYKNNTKKLNKKQKLLLARRKINGTLKQKL